MGLNLPENLMYTADHEWAKIEDNIATIGITDYAQGELGDIVYVELPDVGDQFEKDSEFGSIEAVKAVSELFAPLSGEIIEINDSLEDEPESVNSDPYGQGWMIKIKLSTPEEIKTLLSKADYKSSLPS